MKQLSTALLVGITVLAVVVAGISLLIATRSLQVVTEMQATIAAVQSAQAAFEENHQVVRALIDERLDHHDNAIEELYENQDVLADASGISTEMPEPIEAVLIAPSAAVPTASATEAPSQATP